MTLEPDKSSATEMTLEEAAEELGVHYMSAYRYVRTGRLPARQVGGRWAVDSADLAEFQKAKLNRATKGKPSRADPATKRTSSRRRVKALAERLEQGDEGGSWQILEEFALTAPGSGSPWVGFLADAMNLIGDRWEKGKTSVAEEHQASVVAMRLIGRLGAQARRPGRRKGTIILGAAPGDRHGLPTAMASEVLRSNGFGAIDLGADVPADQMWQVAKFTDRLLAVGYCVTSPLDDFHSQELRASIAHVRDNVGCPVIVGGAAISDRDQIERLGAQLRSSSLEDLVGAAERLHTGGPIALEPEA